ncbi:restriction endonuclease [Cytobacillus sp. S13-E01]|uniref:restriction endonuclease n=1 Tax=Cytobacillus sp. S13-E01 TaxID=3031326 RepID=UPI0023D85C9D|nr:restriction endonuclease [Cytobacillus sp. S13-E01]MDF0728466.1 restriction endonuclease [Cytobacillus sp. S13-E01]
MDTFISIVSAILLVLAAFDVIRRKKENDQLRSMITDSISTSSEIKKTLAMGLFYRFRKESSDISSQNLSSLFIKQSSTEFENFVGNVLEGYYGGIVYLSPPSDYGVNIEHEREDGLFLGQVKCLEKDLGFESIAILHSQILKKKAKGGYIVTTGDFTNLARSYAEDLNIELIQGTQLVKYWIRGLEDKNVKINTIKSTPELV